MKHTVVNVDGQDTVVTVLHNGNIYQAVVDHHPNFVSIVSALRNERSEQYVVSLFDVERTVSNKFKRLTERVTVKDGNVFFDGDIVNNTLTKQIMRFVNEGVSKFEPLVNFMEKVMINPNPNSRVQLFEWLDNHDFTITQDGDIVAYKGVRMRDGVPSSTVSAPAKDKVSVNGELVTGHVPNPDGAVVEMPRSVVDPDEGRHCSVGLHVGTFRYAQAFTGHTLEVHVNPRDVVSVTSDSNREKIRTCRYVVVKHTVAAYSSPVLGDIEDEDEDFTEYAECVECYNEFDADDLNNKDACEECAEEIAIEDARDAAQQAWDTRMNHTQQKRGPGGRFLPKG